MDDLYIFKKMLLIRRFEERVLELFSDGVLSGTTHTCIGQEGIPVVVMEHLLPQDIVWSNHRGHGHYIARTGDINGLLAEMMGLPSGVCGGRGGSQQLCNGNFFSNGVLGSTAPIAAGMALAEKERNSNAIVALFLGDGAFGEGAVYEALNLISLWKLPVLVVVEANGYAQTTPTQLAMAGTLAGRFGAFNIDCISSGGTFVENMYSDAGRAVGIVRNERRPTGLVFRTYRISPHSKGDDFRPLDEIDIWKMINPLVALRFRLTEEDVIRIEAEVKGELEMAENEVRRVSQ